MVLLLPLSVGPIKPATTAFAVLEMVVTAGDLDSSENFQWSRGEFQDF